MSNIKANGYNDPDRVTCNFCGRIVDRRIKRDDKRFSGMRVDHGDFVFDICTDCLLKYADWREKNER